MARSLKKLPFIHKELLHKKLIKRRRSVTVYNRSSFIPARWLGKKIFSSNGLRFSGVVITWKHVGLRVGEFSLTRKLAIWRRKSDIRSGRNRLKVRRK